LGKGRGVLDVGEMEATVVDMEILMFRFLSSMGFLQTPKHPLKETF